MSEKSITRLSVNPAMVNEYGKHGALSESVDGPLVYWKDHLHVLNALQVELCRCVECGHLQAEPNWCHRCGHRTSQPPWAKRLLGELEAAKEGTEAAEQKLETLRLGLEAEVGRLRKEAIDDANLGDERYDDGALSTATRIWARSQSAQAYADRLKALLDQAETAGES